MSKIPCNTRRRMEMNLVSLLWDLKLRQFSVEKKCLPTLRLDFGKNAQKCKCTSEPQLCISDEPKPRNKMGVKKMVHPNPQVAHNRQSGPQRTSSYSHPQGRDCRMNIRSQKCGKKTKKYVIFEHFFPQFGWGVR